MQMNGPCFLLCPSLPDQAASEITWRVPPNANQVDRVARLPPMLVHVGNDEILLDDSVRLVERAEVAGMDVTFKIFEDMWHVFHAFAASVPEAQEAINEIGNYVTKRLEAIEIP